MIPVPAICAFLTFILPFVTAHWSRRHQEVALRARGDVEIHKRDNNYSGARFTFYDVGLGACGQYSVRSDYIVALNVPQFTQYGDGYPSPQCYKNISIQYGGKTTQATIMDECEACPYGGLDFSRGLFDYFADESVGVIYGSWQFIDDDTTSSAWTPPSSTWEPPTTTSTPAYTPPPPTTTSTPVYTPPPTTSSTSVYTPPPTTSSTSSTTLTSLTSSGHTSGLAVSTGGVSMPDIGNPQNILAVNTAMVEFGIALSLFLAKQTD